MKYVLAVLVFVLTGCSVKINPNEFNPINAPKSAFMPQYNKLYSKTHVMVAPFKGEKKYALKATDILKNILINYPSVVVLNRKFSGLKNEIKLAELAKNGNSNLNQADYVITGEIDDVNVGKRFFKPVYWRDKKGYIHKIPGFFRFKACVSGDFNIIKMPDNIVAGGKNFYYCVYKDTKRININTDELIYKALIFALEEEKEYLYNFFAKKGYVYEIRKKGDEIILHTTLGKNSGIEPEMRVDIYTVKKFKIPFSDKFTTQEIKIGKGVVTNVVHDKDSWILVKKYTQPIKIGDYVKPVYGYSFFDSLFE